MNDKIRIFRNKENRLFVSGLDLHNALNCKTPYRKWFRVMYRLCGIEGLDYFSVEKPVYSFDGRLMPQKQHEHYLSMKMAKTVCLFQPKEACQRCLKQLERTSTELEKPRSADWKADGSRENVGLLAMKNDALQGKVRQLEEENSRLRMKADFFDALFPDGIETLTPGVYVCHTDNSILFHGGRLRMQDANKPADTLC